MTWYKNGKVEKWKFEQVVSQLLIIILFQCNEELIVLNINVSKLYTF